MNFHFDDEADCVVKLACASSTKASGVQSIICKATPQRKALYCFHFIICSNSGAMVVAHTS
jgi:hypothetical protein